MPALNECDFLRCAGNMRGFAGTSTVNARRLALLTRQLRARIRVHSVAVEPVSLEAVLNGPPVWDTTAAPTVAAYIHLPFCKRRCHYCDFPVVTTGDPDRQVVQDRFTQYVDKLCEEITKQRRWNAEPLQTLYFGGGTPSLIPPTHLGKIIDTLDSCFGISAEAEITMEADPGTFDACKLKAYMHSGVKRFSVGVQAFSQNSLDLCGRSHNLADVNAAIQAIHDAAPPSWSLDLISGLPGVALQDWEASIQQAISAKPPHISIYDLQVESGTAFQRWQEAGTIAMPCETLAVESWRMSRDLLCSSGYKHYELSNFAQPGHMCAHNMVYWKGYSYYAFGLGAASYLNGVRTARPKSMQAWRQYVNNIESRQDGEAGMDVSVSASLQDKMFEAIMLQLRLVSGLDCIWFANGFGRDCLRRVLHALDKHVSDGKVVFEVAHCPATMDQMMDAVDKHTIANARLHDPDGLLLSNDIISDVFVALDE